KVDVWGAVKTNNSCEKYIEATSVVQTGSGTPLKPISMVIRNVGGGDWHFNPATGAGQRGIFGGFGLNNIGLLIAVTGRVTAVDTDYFYVDDGSLASDNTNNTGIRVEAMGLSVPAVGDTVYVEGISSCFVSSGVTYRRILAVGITNVD
ncbi:MAG: hypothetical protein QME62_05280, partial [Armatimonadota bacterium]|nr:hypothetical protein [Armatimonadota bacterium]